MVEEFIAAKYSKNLLARAYYTDLWRRYAASGLPDRHFAKELRSGDEGKFWERAWEMLLYHHLAKLGHTIRSCDPGPDFEIPAGNASIWVEATVPSPVDLPSNWIEVPSREFGARNVPHEGMLLRWTAALKEKMHKLEAYRAKGIVSDCDPYVIAINACRLSGLGTTRGASGLPIAVEAVFPIGPWKFPILQEEGRLGDPVRSDRFSIKNKNGSDVPTDSFLSPTYAGVSALLGCSTCYAPEEVLEVVIVHNPLASNRLPLGMLGASIEYTAELSGDWCVLKQIVPE
jgi:hypothetical protein